MKASDFSDIFTNNGSFWQRRHGICSRWRNYPSNPAVYLLIRDNPFEWGHEETDILYIGSTTHFGSTPRNNRLWDYHTKATEHEKRIVTEVEKIDAERDVPVKIYWTYKFPDSRTHRGYERFLLKKFRRAHGRPPSLNRSIK